MNDLNIAIDAFNNQNGYVTSYSQRELEAMFDYSYNNGLTPTEEDPLRKTLVTKLPK